MVEVYFIITQRSAVEAPRFIFIIIHVWGASLLLLWGLHELRCPVLVIIAFEASLALAEHAFLLFTELWLCLLFVLPFCHFNPSLLFLRAFPLRLEHFDGLRRLGGGVGHSNLLDIVRVFGSLRLRNFLLEVELRSSYCIHDLVLAVNIILALL